MELTKENLVREIIAEEGLIISEATLNIADLLTTYYDLIRDYNLSDEMAKTIKGFFDKEPTVTNYFYSRCKLLSEKEEEAQMFLNEDLFDFLSDIAPDGFYFGSAEGDGACFGFFRGEKDENEDKDIEDEDELDKDAEDRDALDEIADRVRDGYTSGICGNGVTWSIEINI